MLATDKIRQLYNLDPSLIHLSTCTLASHPKPVRDAIEYYRKELDRNPGHYYRNKDKFNKNVLLEAGTFLGAHPDNIALTESTTMGLAMVFGGLNLQPGDDLIATVHDPYAVQKTLQFKADKTAAKLRIIKLYDEPSKTTKEEIINNIKNAIIDKTRVIALTWVHSNTGVKLPLKEISSEIQTINAKRCDDDKIIICVDAVHGLGVEPFEHIDEFGCDFMISGCHKWLCGPRGTGIVWGSKLGWTRLSPIFASFDKEAFIPWRTYEDQDKDYCAKARLCSPGGFCAFEHRWALADAFKFLNSLGRLNMSSRIKELHAYAKDRISKLPNINLLTPIDSELSSALVCFNVKNLTSDEVFTELLRQNIVIGNPPYRVTSARLAPGLINTKEDIEITINAIQELSSTSLKV